MPQGADPMSHFHQLVPNRLLASNLSAPLRHRPCWPCGECSRPNRPQLINTCIAADTFPTRLKTNKVILLLKSKKVTILVESYQPINICPALSKLVEAHLKTQPVSHMNKNWLIPAGTTALENITHHQPWLTISRNYGQK